MNCAAQVVDNEIDVKITSLNVQQCCGKKCFKLWCVLCAVHGTQYTPQLETLFTNIAEHLTTYFTEYLHKTVTLAMFGIGSLMMVQMDRNM